LDWPKSGENDRKSPKNQALAKILAAFSPARAGQDNFAESFGEVAKGQDVAIAFP
jgi:hypothetical protein